MSSSTTRTARFPEKKAFRWDRTNDEWVPFYQITYQYDDQSGEIKTNYGMWDKKKKNL